MRPVVGILLAAGRGVRFGGDKLLAPLPDGTPVGLAAARRLRAALPEMVAVVRPDDPALIDLFRNEGVTVVTCPDSDQGLSASLRCGIRARGDAAGWLIALADMPFIETATHAAVLAALAEGMPLAAPIYQGQPGHPVGFDAGLRDELLALRGDRGARVLLERHATRLARVAVNDPGVLRDVDTPTDLATS